MLAIFRREISSFFSSPIAYLVIGVFLVFNGLFLWVFKGEFNIFDNGFADMSNFFLLAPWLFLMLIPAITMKSFSEERRLGTIELLFIKPLSLYQIVLGKFLAAMGLIAIALLPTLLYVYCITQLGHGPANPDLGQITGSYFGMFFLIANFAAIGIFSSTLTDNQIVAFITAVILSFVFYFGFEALSGLLEGGEWALFVRNLGMKARVESLARGVLDSRDVVYFLSSAFLFLFLATLQLKTMKR